MSNTIFLGADHAGFSLKERLKPYLRKSGYVAIDCGNTQLDRNDDYPLFGAKVARKVAPDSNSVGILICGSGQGVCIVANKIKGIRAAVAEHIVDAVQARADDDCNVLCLPGRMITLVKAKKIVQAFLHTSFKTEKKYLRRINEVKRIER